MPATYRFLSQEWIAALEALTQAEDYDPIPGATARFQYHIVDAPGGDVWYWEETEDGRLQTLSIGRIDDPQFTFVAQFEAWRDMRRGLMTMGEALESGAVTVEGDVEAFRRLAALGEMAFHEEHDARVRAMTQF